MSGGTSPRYTSQGTISVSFRHKHEVLFFPEHDYSIRHGNKTFAVFMSVSKKSEKTFSAIVRRRRDRDGDNSAGVKITVKEVEENDASFMMILTSAATSQQKVEVEVEVEVKDDEGLKLTGITVPVQ